MAMKERIKKILTEAEKAARDLSGDAPTQETIARVASEMIKCLKNGGKIIVFGDGGSAADSQHLACELVVRFKKDRAPIPAIALTTNASNLTAIGNDYSFDDVFSRQLAAIAKNGDVAMGISTSGNSPNVLKAVEEANKMGVLTIGLTGKDGGRLKGLCKHSICVPATATPRIQELHIKILHIIAELIEDLY